MKSCEFYLSAEVDLAMAELPSRNILGPSEVFYDVIGQ